MSKVRAVLRCPEEYKKEFATSSCLLTISVGQATHEGELFEATMEIVGKSFASCTILVDDVLQRHTMAITDNKDPNHFYDLAKKEGDFWLDRNEKYYKRLGIPLTILRWEKWLIHSQFQDRLKLIKKQMLIDSLYKNVVDKSINDFLQKLSKRVKLLSEFDWDRAYQLSYDFVTEECAALCLWPELGSNFELYPIKHNEAINETRNRFVLPQYPNLLRAVNIVFKNAGQLQPQNFSFL